MVFEPGLLESLAGGRFLERGEAAEAMRSLLEPEDPDPLKAAFLALIRARGAAPEELAGFAGAIREGGRLLAGVPEGLIDTCGTGGGAPSFNLSTGAAILAAAAGGAAVAVSLLGRCQRIVGAQVHFHQVLVLRAQREFVGAAHDLQRQRAQARRQQALGLG